MKDGGGSQAPLPTANAGTDKRFCYRNSLKQNKKRNTEARTSGRSCSQGVGERERERLRIVRKEGKYRSNSISGVEGNSDAVVAVTGKRIWFLLLVQLGLL